MSKRQPKKYYKSLTDSLKSALYKSGLPREVAVQYKEGEFVKPNIAGTQLMVWDNLKKAQQFKREWCFEGSVWEVEVKNPRKTGIFYRNILELCGDTHKFIQTLKYMIGLRQKKQRYIIHGHADASAVFVDEVKLVKRIE